MKYHLYTSLGQMSLFDPEGSVLSFKCPIKHDERMIYVFDKIPSSNIVKDYELKKTLTLDEIENIDDLKKTLRDKEIWKIFNFIF